MTTQRGEKVKRVEELARSFQQHPLAAHYRPRLCRPWEPSSVWRLFPRQSAALAFAKGCKEDVHVFALERELTEAGQRIYLVTSYSELWHYYRTFRHSLMHCYEVIPEGAVCKVYFDLEFHKPSNEGLDGPQMVQLLIQYVCRKLNELYGVSCSAEDVLNLDSSTDDKFSRHLVFVLPDAAFKDNAHVGRFVHKILQPVLESLQEARGITEESAAPEMDVDWELAGSDELGSPQPTRRKPGGGELHFLRVKDKEGRWGLLVDLGVYTKNRNFRLYKSSKAGKNTAFTVAADNRFVPRPDRQLAAEECLFLASLVTNVSFTGQKILTLEVSDAKNMQASFRRPALHHPSIAEPLDGSQSSPYKEVDEFILSLVRKDGVQGAVRRCSYFEAEQLLVYDILRYRWCGNVARCHRSNNIMILVDLKEEVWYQKCHDPVCRSQNYRSSSYPLPQDICFSYLMKEDNEDLEYLMDDMGNIESSQRREGSQAPSAEQLPDWELWPDDEAHLEALEEMERTSAEEVPDELLLESMAQFESSEYAG
ncbi:DNA-directed primase/polymerase protein [Paramormyrops kingsleyae]|uniref:DNA-directed primase/polymerase protein n=1 Tax=Paramormyrops kingsleyae TaxID=1676925 RepID=A0A3B3QPC5_9TELE|nr:DNA-directed primase/polymerase protein [Paramormyrops kingsleyae]XP_023686410.1 DNA-directed primase/polymerase protein [Paramormyrops kingsleyae]XP_023686411.1 DNA-directed primase/polymerase protein [Paramormyrops kingsleyae]XP_023686412.1 DNA-directed primase/polymerase protein [Paramormyrops kingsleyae]